MKNFKKIKNFIESLDIENLYILDYVTEEDFENMDFSNAFYELEILLDGQCAFDIEIIYYSEAIEYLSKNDLSLKESLELANELGYELKDLNSEILASLLASEKCRNEFYESQKEITEFFNNL